MSGIKGKSGRKIGFKNPNAGRPVKPDENKKVTISIRIKPENLKWLNENVKNKSAFIDEIIDKQRSKNKWFILKKVLQKLK